MRVVADVHERRSGVPATLRTLNIRVEERALEVGDYSIDDAALVERKTVPDLHVSVVQGRLWRQIGNLRRASPWQYLVVEGPMLYDGPLSPEAVRGVLLSIAELGVIVVRSVDSTDSASWISRIARRHLAEPRRIDRPVYAQRPKRDPHVAPPEQALAAAPGVSTKTARALLTEFGSLMNVLLATPQSLRRVPGVGPERARAIHELATSTSDSGVSRNCERPST